MDFLIMLLVRQSGVVKCHSVPGRLLDLQETSRLEEDSERELRRGRGSLGIRYCWS